MDTRFDVLITILVFSVFTLLSNIIPHWIKLPWDLDLSKVGIGFYIPIFSSLIVAAAIILSRQLLGI